MSPPTCQSFLAVNIFIPIVQLFFNASVATVKETSDDDALELFLFRIDLAAVRVTGTRLRHAGSHVRSRNKVDTTNNPC